MKYFLISEKIFKSINFPLTYNLSEVLEATPENIQKLNLIPKKEKKEFKVGDKIAAYGVAHSSDKTSRVIGKIIKVDGYLLNVLREDSGGEYWFHIKQCRKLIPKPKPKAVMVTRKQLEAIWNNQSVYNAHESEDFKDICKNLGL